MKIEVFTDYSKMSEKSAELVANVVKNKSDAVICLPSGETPKGMFDCLIGLKQKGSLDMSRCRFVALDEWLGFGRHDSGGCRFMLDRDFFIPMDIKEEQIIFFDGLSTEPQSECDRMESYLEKYGPIDIMILGIGMNGHLGLNEPGTDLNTRAHLTELDQVTMKVAVKYDLDSGDLKGGITLGFQNILESKIVLLQASGERKAEIVKKAVKEDITTDVPASILRNHAECYFYLDEKAAALI